MIVTLLATQACAHCYMTATQAHTHDCYMTSNTRMCSLLPESSASLYLLLDDQQHKVLLIVT